MQVFALPLSLQLREYGHRSRVTLMVLVNSWTSLFPNVLIPGRPNSVTSLFRNVPKPRRPYYCPGSIKSWAKPWLPSFPQGLGEGPKSSRYGMAVQAIGLTRETLTFGEDGAKDLGQYWANDGPHPV